jgi:hypothetical protein
MPVLKRKSAFRAALAMAAVAASIGCTVDQSKLSPTEEQQRRENLRRVRGDTNQFTTDVGDPQGRGQIPRGR